MMLGFNKGVGRTFFSFGYYLPEVNLLLGGYDVNVYAFDVQEKSFFGRPRLEIP